MMLSRVDGNMTPDVLCWGFFFLLSVVHVHNQNFLLVFTLFYPSLEKLGYNWRSLAYWQGWTDGDKTIAWSRRGGACVRVVQVWLIIHGRALIYYSSG